MTKSKTVTTYEANDYQPSERFDTFFNELFSESDRGCILIGASVLDEVLGEYIAYMISLRNLNTKTTAHEKQITYNPKLSFGDKIKFANRIKILKKDVFEDLDKIRIIRNKAAHDYKPRNFKDKEIIDIVHTFNRIEQDPVQKSKEWEIMIDEITSIAPNGVTKGTRRTYEAFIFSTTVVYIVGMLDFRSYNF